jgi:hypothetical protein
MSDDLVKRLPCPFCGGESVEITGKGQIWRGLNGYSDPQYFQLNHWGQLSEKDDFPRCVVEFRVRTEREAVEFWNARAALAALKKQREVSDG